MASTNHLLKNANEVRVKYVTHFPLLGILALIFITLKLTGYIAWSWWWVLAPLWAPWAILFGIIGLVMTFVGVGLAICWIIEKATNK